MNRSVNGYVSDPVSGSIKQFGPRGSSLDLVDSKIIIDNILLVF